MDGHVRHMRMTAAPGVELYMNDESGMWRASVLTCDHLDNPESVRKMINRTIARRVRCDARDARIVAELELSHAVGNAARKRLNDSLLKPVKRSMDGRWSSL